MPAASAQYNHAFSVQWEVLVPGVKNAGTWATTADTHVSEKAGNNHTLNRVQWAGLSGVSITLLRKWQDTERSLVQYSVAEASLCINCFLSWKCRSVGFLRLTVRWVFLVCCNCKICGFRDSELSHWHWRGDVACRMSLISKILWREKL